MWPGCQHLGHALHSDFGQPLNDINRARGSAVEHPLHTRGVDGSIPSAPTSLRSASPSYGQAGCVTVNPPAAWLTRAPTAKAVRRSRRKRGAEADFPLTQAPGLASQDRSIPAEVSAEVAAKRRMGRHLVPESGVSTPRPRLGARSEGKADSGPLSHRHLPVSSRSAATRSR